MKWLWRFVSIVLLYLCTTGICLAGELVVEILDVGQADAILITGAGKRVLVDAGEQAKDGDILTVATQLKNRGIDHLDMVFATHPHADHIGGMQGVLETQQIKAYVDNGFPHTSTMYENLMTVAEDKVMNQGMRYIVARKGQVFKLGDEARFEILAPVDDTGIAGTRSDINANSIVMKLIHGDNCFLLMGDAEAETEALVAEDAANCNVLKASHHGSPHSSTAPLLDSANPQVALLSCGLANKHGHPGASTLDEYNKRGIKYYRTDWQGAIKVVSNGQSLEITTEKDLSLAELPCINVNTRDMADFNTLKGIGKTTSDKIEEARMNHPQPFTSVDEFLENLSTVSEDASHRLSKFTDYLSLDCSMRGRSAVATTVITPPAVTPDGKVNINLASEAELASMPGMSGPKAKAVIAYREANGNFKNCGELTKVKGIGQKTVNKLVGICVVHSMPPMPMPGAHGPMHRGPHKGPAAEHIQPPTVVPDQAPAEAAQPTDQGDVININVADVNQLTHLPTVGAKKAQDIIDYRNTNGPFTSCMDLAKIRGFGQKSLEKLLPKCSVK